MPDELDTLLDHAIKTYSAAEPSPDLAARILRQAQMQAPLPRHGWKLVLAFALPVAAALTLAFILPGRGTLPKLPATIASAPTTPSVTPTRVQTKRKRWPPRLKSSSRFIATFVKP